MLRKAKSLSAYHLGALDGELGRVKDFYFDDASWRVRYLVADTGKWLPHRKVLISPHAFGPINDDEGVLHIRLTREQIEHSPSMDAHKPVSRQYEEEYLRYFGWPFYWSEPLMWGVPANMPAADVSAPREGDPHLRSMNEVDGYHLQASDGEIGHVEDFLLDDAEWIVRDLIVDTRNWLPGKRVLVAPQWIKKVSWEQARVVVSADRGTVQKFPEYNPEGLPEDKTQERIFQLPGHLP